MSEMNPDTLEQTTVAESQRYEAVTEQPARHVAVAKQLAEQQREYAFPVVASWGYHARVSTLVVNALKEHYAGGEVQAFYRKYNPDTDLLEHRTKDSFDPASVLDPLTKALPQRSMVYFVFKSGEPSQELVEAIKDALETDF